MPEQLLSLIFVVGVVIAALILVTAMGNRIIDISFDENKFHDAEASLRKLDNAITEVAGEGNGSTRLVKLKMPDSFTIDDGAITYRLETEAMLIDYPNRDVLTSVKKISGDDVVCRKSTELIMENDHVRALFLRADAFQTIDTKNIIVSIEQKDTNVTIRPVDSSIIIDDDPLTSTGTGYTELLGTRGPLCTVRAHINNTISYDVFYTLYAGADFIEVKVKNIK